MVRLISLLNLLLFILPYAGGAQDTLPAFNVYWDGGINIDSKNGNFTTEIGGLIQFHSSFFSQDKQITNLFGDINDRTELRRIRLYNKGTFYNSVKYKLQIDFAGEDTELKDGYISLVNLPVAGNIRVGHFKEPFSLDMMTSTTDVTFLERSPVTAFKKQRNNGLILFNTARTERATWAFGVFQNTDDFGTSAQEDKYNVTGRVTGVPYLEEDKNRLLHLGVAYSYRNPSQKEFEAAAQPESNLAPDFVKTGIENTDSNHLIGTEVALVWDSFSFQSEYIASIANTTQSNFLFSGYYIESTYFLTGEHKNYSTKSATFKSITPETNYDPAGDGEGAWEVAFRYSNLDLNDETVRGGILNDYSLGLNWYLNPATLFSFNYTWARLQRPEIDGKGNAHILQTKFQVAF